MIQQTCTKCKVTKEINEFTINRTKKSGFESRCKTCRNEDKREYRKRDHVKVKERAYEKKYRKENPDKLKVYNKKRWQNPEVRAYKEEYRKKNPEIFKKSYRKYKENHFDKYTVTKHLIFAKENGLRADWTREEYNDLVEFFNGKCPLTGDTEDLSVDHFIPISTGHGGTYSGNIVVISKSMNLRKGNKNPFLWADTLKDEEIQGFIRMVRYLADKNNMSPEEFKDYVEGCFN
ncbi:hypothetical protein [Geomicrobium sediminis]|uniref:5-methylcytosine-specific restriction endonuclease McrA n=1 Tax=Geomicrobium sediminis TaxID=1347788 RepID=A0ABS2PFU0_9BACL|nr:hypothetical protein [Geomicrobium sediminis]MBM7633846.1 5-methylcytosine-specific restriction endonuclease McrA [Geomicrobium sediminis]